MWKRIFESEIWEGKRKFFIAGLALGIAVIFRILNLIDGHDCAAIVKDVTIAFLGANLMKHIINTAQDYIDLKISKDKPDQNSK